MANTTTTTTPRKQGGGGHILMFPFPAQGHILPLLDLVHQLAIRATTTTTITILVTPKNLPILNPLLIQHPSIVQTLVLPFPTHPGSLIPPGVENVKNLPPLYFIPMIKTMSKLYDPILNWFRFHSSPPTCIISDFFLGWTQNLASQLGIRRIVFCPSGALTLSIFSSLWRDLPTPAYDDNDVPGCPTYPWWQLSPLYRDYVQGKESGGFSNSDGLEAEFLANVESWGMVLNSFQELEGIYLDHMKQAYFGNKRVWAVGPLSKPGPNERSGTNTRDDIFSTVVYICFGSQTVLNNAQMEALAVGLEKSGVKFVWCVKEPTVGHVSGEGLVVRGWAPQVLILKHKAIGSFLTHCGWNSVLESIAAGVPMLAWPMGADQYVNAILLVDGLKVGVRVCEGEKTVPDADELARCMAESVAISNTGKNEMKLKAMELKQAATEAVSCNENGGGSSFNDLDDLVQHIF
ncbi:hypothetical protein MKW94_006887 [Papaver nudicaule]|uniref:Glycosyltransferase n=1 Tax=Papaver nudicaule TaxID=74823 RepID=A0AA41VFL9_PAPNU|nr:hypothetical protein [Papaver nudicaule]